MAPARVIVSGASRRLDHLVRDELGVGRRAVATLISGGAVRVNGRVAAKSTVVTAGDEVTVDDAATAERPLTAVDVPLAIVHCDADMVVVDKPPGMPSTGGPSGAPSVAAALLHRFPEMAAIDRVRAAGLVHRLDTGTSGLLVAARTLGVYERLRAAFAAKAIVKDYLAVVHGQVTTPGTVGVPLARRARSRHRMVVAAGGTGWPAETVYVPLAIGRELTLVGLRMRTGVTHQLRVHLAHLGHPVVGDRRYAPRTLQGGEEWSAAGRTGEDPWHYLHALRIESDRGELPRELATAFPAHWRAIFAALDWSTEVPPRW